MNWHVGVSSEDHPYQLFARSSDFNSVSPSRIFTFIDEHEDTIQCSAYYVGMGNSLDGGQSSLWNFSIPSSRHGNAGSLAFADGHVEMRRWVDSKTALPVKRDYIQWIGDVTLPNRDAAWLAERATVIR